MDLQGNHVDYALNGKVMLCTGLILFGTVLSVLCFHNYVRILFRDTRRRYMRHRARRLLSISTAANTSKGLDSSVIKTIPIMVYATKASCFPPLDCPVCLSEFENDDKTRVLPECNHTFHVDCIDMWFYSHSNCPLCRATIQAVKPMNPEKTAGSVAETAGSEPARDDIENPFSSSFSSYSSSSSLELESCSMQKLELVGIVVEVPTGAP
ncbi:RING-H2 finger protein ATL17 [Hibiscus syriacus]|uniref:RING-type E3 ubiquitin transferase n=1 Tax=Hibiscus syriacus TaxID=106335 RepID=A0A6A2XQT0_HIBSY|nr:RING-H2 finger protein ATL5-like [Hibiscus syriacus]KAE8672230.1 RING-H2 finger protein ATL17 [Hibiscus syriacus]